MRTHPAPRQRRRGAALAALTLVSLFAIQASGDDSSTLLFVWGETTTVAEKAGWGRMTPLKDGRWLAVTTRYPHPNSILRLSTSNDSGRTWTPGVTIRAPGRNLDNGEVRQLPNGDILLTGRSVVDGHTPGATLSYALPVYRSTDNGSSWKQISSVDSSDPSPYQPGRASQGLWEPQCFLLADGRIACAYANETHSLDKPIGYSQTVAERVSNDRGATWGREITLAAQIGGGRQRPGMPVVARLRDGQYIAVYEVVGIGNADVHEKFSSDGVTWPEGIGTPIPDHHAGPFVAVLADGRVVVSSCSNKISVSEDNGVTWRLVDAAFPELGQVYSWPAIYQMGDGRVGVMTTRGGVRIRWGRLTSTNGFGPKEPTSPESAP